MQENDRPSGAPFEDIPSPAVYLESLFACLHGCCLSP